MLPHHLEGADCIVIPPTEHQLPPLPIGYGVKLFALKADGTADFTVSLDHEKRGGECAADGPLTIHLLTPCSGVVCVWPPARLYVER